MCVMPFCVLVTNDFFPIAGEYQPVDVCRFASVGFRAFVTVAE